MSIFAFTFQRISRHVGLFATGIVLSVLATSTYSQPISANVPASATVVTPLTFGSISTLNFGAFAPGAGGTVTIPVSGPRVGSGVTLMSTNVGGPSTITLAGSPELGFTLALPESVTLSSASSSMIVGLLKTSLTSSNTGIIPASGTATFLLGGTLTVKANQPTGVYLGSVPITVNYP